MGAATLECPKCGRSGLDLRKYDSMIVISTDYALFTLTCEACGQRISGLRAIPDSLYDEVRFAAIEVGAGMGRSI